MAASIPAPAGGPSSNAEEFCEGALRLEIRLVSGELFDEVSLFGKALVAELLQSCEAKGGTPQEYLDLLLDGQLLDPKRCLVEEGIVDGSQLLLVRRMPEQLSLHEASGEIHARYFLECGADANELRNEWTPLHTAANRFLPAVCHQLLQHKAFTAVNAVDWMGRTALHLAAEQGLESVCRAILKRRDFTLVNKRESSGSTALHMAAYEGDASICAAIAAHRDFTALDVEDKFGETVLQSAFGMGCQQVCEAIASRGNALAINHCRVEGLPFLHWSIVNSLTATAMHLLWRADFKGANVKDRFGRTPLHCSAECAQESVCSAILARDDFTLLNERDASGRSALDIAMEMNAEDVCETIISRSDFADINQRDKEKRSLLHWAASKGHENTCLAILARPDFALVNEQDRLKCTALHYIAGKGLSEACKEIIKRKDFHAVGTRDAYGDTAFMMAARMRTDYYRIGCEGSAGQHYERVCDTLEMVLGASVK